MAGAPKAFISDLGNVVMMFDHERAYRALGELLHLRPADVHERIRASGLRRKLEVGEVSGGEFPRRLLEALGSTVTVSTDALAQSWSDIFSLNEPMVEALTQLRRQVPIALLSNTDVLHFGFISKRFPDVVGLFDGRQILSYEVRTAKPDAAIYRKALEVVGLLAEPGRAIYVDDIPEYVAGARSLGINAFQYERHGLFADWLRREGLDVA